VAAALEAARRGGHPSQKGTRTAAVLLRGGPTRGQGQGRSGGQVGLAVVADPCAVWKERRQRNIESESVVEAK